MESGSNDIASLVGRVLSESEAGSFPAPERFRTTKSNELLHGVLGGTGFAKGKGLAPDGGFVPTARAVFDTAASVAAEGMAGWLGADTLGTGPIPALRRSSYEPSEGSRYMIAPGPAAGESVVLILDPDVAYGESRRITEEIDFDPRGMLDVMGGYREEALGFGGTASPMREVLAAIQPYDAVRLIEDVRPEVVVSHLPRMVPLCVPSPHVAVEAGSQSSTAGIFCRDGDGELGITACYHGTGPAGTLVTVGLRQFRVRHASPVQDLVFIPLGDDYNVTDLCGGGGVVFDRAPGEGDAARFEGSTSGPVETRIASYDAGLLRKRPTVQLKVQTRADASPGDSGSALVDRDERVLAFAFEGTEYGDYPSFTDWIWADNALAALGLTPLKLDGGE